MMFDNELTALPNSVGVANSDMTVFPDATSAVGTADKLNDPDGVAYTDGVDPLGDKDGYILRGHDITGDDSATGLVNYLPWDTAQGTYTVNADGTVTQVTTGYEVCQSLESPSRKRDGNWLVVDRLGGD